jgi:TonB family protein
MITGKKPFEGASTEIGHGIADAAPRAPSGWSPGLPPYFSEVFTRALAKDLDLRFPSATAFVAALGRRSGHPAIAPTGSRTPDRTGAAQADVESAGPRERPLVAPVHAREPRAPSWVQLSLLLGTVALLVTLGNVVLWRSTVPRTPTGPEPLGSTKGGLDIETQPASARVWLDGVERGRAPLTLFTRPGPHAVRVALDGFSSAELAVDLPREAPAVRLRFTLQPTNAILQIRSEPTGAVVAIDGRSVGTTPVEGLAVRPGSHRVQVSRTGLATWTQDVEARLGDRIPLLARLAGPAASPGMAHLKGLGWVHEGDFVEPGADVTPPQKTSGEFAFYPEPARTLKLRGTVTVDMTVTEAGEPVDLRVVDSAGEILDDAVLAAVRTWRYTPAQKNDVKVRTRLRVQQTFAGGY